ncbi:MAG TPA: flavodoxin domain-containing protein [Candidatus Limnocylindrales bacterium]|nr:flavodoxin domain-containing protein [Candidatus Limnocylindrales bacterium]
MNTLVIYDSKFGNTEKVAEAIARGVGSVSEVSVTGAAEAAQAVAMLPGRPDLLIVGGPTQNHGPSAGLRDLVNAVPASLRGVPVACFDTRYRGPALLMGSAASAAAKAMARTGAEMVASPESFFIARRGPMPLQTLEPGEIERAEQWGRAVAMATPAAGLASGHGQRT